MLLVAAVDVVCCRRRCSSRTRTVPARKQHKYYCAHYCDEYQRLLLLLTDSTMSLSLKQVDDCSSVD
jgi:hypothetical protein